MKNLLISAACAATAAAPALAGYTVTGSETPAPTYSTTLTFDEGGVPVGVALPTDAFASFGVSSLMAGDGFNRIDNFSAQPGFGWLPDSNAFIGGFGVFMNFDTDITEMSAQVWDNSGPATLFGGGMIVALYNDGNEVSFNVVDPAFGGAGNSWFNITTDNGDVFDEVRFVGLGFAGPLTILGQASWNAVPAPGALALLGLGGIAAGRRRRA
jgi:MYXO-CTERM domain-containing protein